MKEYLQGLYKEYQKILKMTDDEVMQEYDETKAEIINVYESEIDWYESNIYGYVG